MYLTPAPSVAEVRAAEAKALSPTVITLSGTVTVVITLFSNAPSAITTVVAGIVNEVAVLSTLIRA